MRLCACLWGGTFNPIIPVFKKPPAEWKPEKFEAVKGLDVASGYVRFFEPDVYVEAEEGLLEDAGLGALREKHTMEPSVLSLSDLLAPRDHREWAEFAVGLGMNDVLRDLYKTERRFSLLDPREAVLVKSGRSGFAAEAMFGVFPAQRDASYFGQNYKDVFHPKVSALGPAVWLEVFKKGCITPLRVTQHALEFQWQKEPVIFVFDPSRVTDVIDLWNMRLEPHPVLPVPIEWVDALLDHLCEEIENAHRPIRGNPSGLMHQSIVEFGRSIGEARAEKIAADIAARVPKSAFGFKLWRNRVWAPETGERVHRDWPLTITAKEESTKLVVTQQGDGWSSSFDTLSPDFAERYGGHHMRWSMPFT